MCLVTGASMIGAERLKEYVTSKGFIGFIGIRNDNY
jgi:hypothetical protein